MRVCEIFTSIQGESTYAGLPCVFVRLTGCNLRCAYCDTTYAYDEGIEMSENEIVEKVREHGIKLVEITGGEPLLQKDVLHLMTALFDSGFTVLLETNGSVSIKDVDKRVIIIMDIKTPKSGMFEEMDLMNLKHLKPHDEVKFVVMDREDYEWVVEFIKDYGLAEKCKILLSPAFGMLSSESLSKWIIEDKLSVRLNMQLHKYIYGHDKRRV
ncbi:MAG: radical SAM protein [Thermodesulfovibrionales bacterium]|nr:radical SAM protein [Thermodesulfovibrionales bacterium]